MNRFPIIDRLKVENYRLFPGTEETPGIDFSFQTGVSLLAGINGLGKTTLVNMLYRLIVGPWELPKDDGNARFGAAARGSVVQWSGRTRFFSQRVADHAKQATASIWFRIGDHQFFVCRSLSNLRLVDCSVNNSIIVNTTDESAYQQALCLAAEASAYADFLISVKYLTFFNEERRDILWDEQAQRQFFRILFSSPEDALNWTQLEQEISRTDSRARNLSASAFQYEQDLIEKEKLLVNNAGVSARLAAEQKLLDADLKRQTDLQASALDLESDLKKIRRDLERTKLAEDDARSAVESIRYLSLAKLFPSLNETAQYVLTQLYSEGRCLACGNLTHDTEHFERALAKGLCAICGSDVGASIIEGESLSGIGNLEGARVALQNATLQRDSLSERERDIDARWRATLTELANVSEAINRRAADTVALRKQLPPDPADIAQLRKNIEQLRKSQKQEEEKRQTTEILYEQLLERVNGRIQDATHRVASIFQGLIERFLEESCTLTYKVVRDRPSVNGRRFNYPALRFEMTAAAFEGKQIRETPDDVSESQREFIDLAFRMALMEAASSDGNMSLVIETPEASLDVIFMERAAEMFREFANSQRSVIATSNLTSSVMIPALMGPHTNDPSELARRRGRILNLLDIAAPNAAIRRHKELYSEFLNNGLHGEGP